ncbi:stage II sporulation protein M [Archaeoglobus sp.]
MLTNNFRLIFIMVAGSFCLGTPTIKNLFLNGYTTGSVLSTNLKLMLALFVPHAILEISAIIIAGAAGFKIPYEILRYLLGRKERILTQEDIKEYLTLALISIILIVIAAWIEANITLEIAKTVLGSTKSILKK